MGPLGQGGGLNEERSAERWLLRSLSGPTAHPGIFETNRKNEIKIFRKKSDCLRQNHRI